MTFSFFTSSCMLDAKIYSLNSNVGSDSLTNTPALRNYKISIVNQPTDSVVMTELNSIQVQLIGDDNQIVDLNIPLTIQIISSSPNASKLYGSITAETVSGIAFFNNLAVDLPGSDYSLIVQDSNGKSESTIPFNIVPRNLEVTPFFPINGRDFMSYVPRDPAKLLHEQVDTSVSSGRFYFHGGEMRKVALSGFLDCEGLSMTDNLGVFNWQCYSQGEDIFYYSHNFNANKGLRDLVNTTSFKDIKIVLKKNNIVVGESVLATTWWSNPIVPLTLNSGVADSVLNLNTSGTIYTVASSGASRGIQMTSARIALVTLGTSVITNTASVVTDCESFTGGVQSNCLVSASGQAGWIEVNLNTNLGLIALATGTGESTFSASNRCRIHNTKILTSHANSYGIKSMSGLLNMTDVEVSTAGQMGIYLDSGYYGTFNNIKITGGAVAGVYTSSVTWYQSWNKLNVMNAPGRGYDGSSFHVSILNSKFINNMSDGVRMSGNNVNIQNSMSSNNNGDGIYLISGSNEFVSGNLIANNTGVGLFMSSHFSFTPGLIENNIFSNNQTGLRVNSSNRWNFKNNFFKDNSTAITINGTSANLQWSGKLILSNNLTSCNVTSTGVNPGLLNGSCNNQGISTANKVDLINTSNYFTGLTADSANQHTTGSILYSGLLDWFSFETIWRAWSKPGSFAGACATGDTCFITDYSLTPQATEILYVNGNPIAAETCPTSIHGSQYHIINNGYALLNSYEIYGDYIGNENGFCESNENCQFKPHIGVYQLDHQGSPQNCNFEADVNLSNITIFF